MSAAGRFLRKVETGYLHWCPGCESAHHIWVGNASGPNWSFDGNVDAPTFNPSVRVFTPAYKDEDCEIPETTECHYFIRAGKIEFCGDSAHDLRGQTVPLPEFPENYGY